MQRREFLQAASSAALLNVMPVPDEQPRVVTVTGAVTVDQLGVVLPHEHILVDFVGADQVTPNRYDADEAFRVMLPYVNQAKVAGCKTLAECTPAYLGRDPRLLQRLSKKTGVHFLTNTGYYGAAQGKFLPQHAHRESADVLAKRWIDEWEHGIDGTGIRPGFIKIGVDAGPLSRVNRKLVRAAARCHLRTGLPIAGHTGDGRAALEQVDILKEEGVSPSAWIWVHAQNERDAKVHLQVAQAGGWVEFDGVAPTSVDRHVDLVLSMLDVGLLDRVLLSHDAGWYSVGEPRGGSVRGFDTLLKTFVPALRKAGLREDQVRQLTERNPAEAFAIGVRST